MSNAGLLKGKLRPAPGWSRFAGVEFKEAVRLVEGAGAIEDIAFWFTPVFKPPAEAVAAAAAAAAAVAAATAFAAFTEGAEIIPEEDIVLRAPANYSYIQTSWFKSF